MSKNKETNLLEVQPEDVGCTCLVGYDDIGKVECLIVEAEKDDKYITVFGFCNDALDKVHRDQIKMVGRRIKLGEYTP